MAATTRAPDANGGGIDAEGLQRLRQQLFADRRARVFAVLDGAGIPDLLSQLRRQEPLQVCLFRGALEPEVAEVAPYLVQLEPGAGFTRWLLETGWGRNWGVFAVTEADMLEMRKHFRRLLMVALPDGKRAYFRFYDPRVLRCYLPTCTPEEVRGVFGPVRSFLCEDEDQSRCLSFSAEAEGCRMLALALAESAREV